MNIIRSSDWKGNRLKRRSKKVIFWNNERQCMKRELELMSIERKEAILNLERDVDVLRGILAHKLKRTSGDLKQDQRT